MVPNTINNKNIYGIKNGHMSQYLPSHFEKNVNVSKVNKHYFFDRWISNILL